MKRRRKKEDDEDYTNRSNGVMIVMVIMTIIISREFCCSVDVDGRGECGGMVWCILKVALLKNPKALSRYF